MRRKRPSRRRPAKEETDLHPNPFKIKLSGKSALGSRLLRPSSRLLERLLFFHQLETLYYDTLRNEGGKDFMRKLLDEMNVSYEVPESGLARIPAEGPVVVVANHPYGGIESIIMCALLRSVRDDTKVLANHLLNRIPEVREYCIFVDPFGGESSAKVNIRPVKEAVAWIRDGGLLGLFPAGEVSHVSLKGRGVVDRRWSASIGRIIRMTQAPVVPMFIEGHNGPAFQMAGMIHPRLRTAMLPRELLNKRNRKIRIEIGSAIPFEKLKDYERDADMIEFLRFRTYLLESRLKTAAAKKRRTFRKKKVKPDEEIALPESPELMRAEIEHLPPDHKLVESGEFSVFVAQADEIRHVLHEIGRLREATFRQEREGTGKSRDLDRFDEYYLHLFVWHKENREVVGAYRLGCTDELLARFGKRGLYTSTLFRYRKKLLKMLNPGLEMGRSFVRLEYQKNYSSLLMLWKGIGRFIVANPRYTKMFGPVSISNDYHSVSRGLLASFLTVNEFESEMARMIKAKKPPRPMRIKGCAPTIFNRAIKDLETISSVIAEIESDHKGAPVLLKQYLRLGGKLMGFNIDPAFGNVLDGLIVVDLLQTDRKQIERFMGKDGFASFMKYHNMT